MYTLFSPKDPDGCELVTAITNLGNHVLHEKTTSFEQSKAIYLETIDTVLGRARLNLNQRFWTKRSILASPLERAIIHGLVDIAEKLINNGASVTLKIDGHNMLQILVDHISSYHKDSFLKMAELLINNGLVIDARCREKLREKFEGYVQSAFYRAERDYPSRLKLLQSIEQEFFTLIKIDQLPITKSPASYSAL